MNTYQVYAVRMSPALNGSYALECFERSNAIKIRQRNNVQFLLGTATCISLVILMSFHFLFPLIHTLLLHTPSPSPPHTYTVRGYSRVSQEHAASDVNTGHI